MAKYLHNIFDGTSGNAMIFVALMVVALMVVILAITMFLLVRQYFFRRRAARDIRMSQRYNDLLVDCLFSADKGMLESCKMKGKKGKPQLFKSMIYLMQNLDGELSGTLKSLFYDLGLEKYLLRKLRSKRWWRLTEGLRESRIMGFKKAIGFAEKHINSPHLELRVEAQISIIALKTLDPFEFLSRLKRPFSIWARINLYQEISRWQQKPDATKWLNVSNPGVLVFALRVMGLFNQKARAEDIEPLIEHPEPNVRAELIRYAAIAMDRELWLKTAMKFKTETVEVRQKIGQTCGMLPDIPVNLLINWFNWEKSTIVKIELARSILIHGQAAGLKPGELDALGVVA